MRVSGGIHINLAELPKGVFLNGFTTAIHKRKDGSTIPSASFEVEGVGIEVDIFKFEFSVDGALFAPVLPAGVSYNDNVVTINPLLVTFNTMTILASAEDPAYRDVFTITVIEDGHDGEDGGPGKGVASVLTWYYRSTSPSDQTGGTWTISKPDYLAGTFLWTKTITTYTDESTTETVPVLDPDWHKIQAITDKFGTTTEGGLIQTVMMLLRDLNSVIETAGISGIQGELRNNPAFWAGGTYAEAFKLISFLLKMSNDVAPDAGEYDGLAKITMLHNGAAKVGDFIIEESGRIVMIDPATGKVRLAFTVYDLPLITDLMGGVNFSGSTNIGAATGVSTSRVLSGSTNVTKNGASATFNGTTITISAFGQHQPSGMSSYAEARLYARRNGVRYLLLASASVMFTSPQNELLSDSQTVSQFGIISIQSGLYTFELVVETSGAVTSPSASVTASAFSWEFTEQNVRMQQYGLDGMMFFYSNHHFHFTEGGGLDGRALPDKWNVPGVLLSASVQLNGGFSNWWGAKKHTSNTATRNSTGRYTVYHSIGHTEYQVTASPSTANKSYHIVSQGVSSFVIEWRTIGSSPALVDTAFSVQVTGNNYN